MRPSRSPPLIPLTIDSSTCSGPICDLLSIYSCVLWKSTILDRARSVNIDDTAMSRELPSKRKYELKKRAEEMAETHRRITEAALELHGTVGPSRTTLSAVAKRAGVERRTLYRHFPTEADLFAGCSAYHFTANPWPELVSWRALRDPQQ